MRRNISNVNWIKCLGVYTVDEMWSSIEYRGLLPERTVLPEGRGGVVRDTCQAGGLKIITIQLSVK